jgi:arsenite methyltransferase
MGQIVFDESIVGQLEALYRTRDVIRRRRLIRTALGAGPGERILDAGCGPGFYSSELHDEVGSDGSVVGVDSSPQMLAVAARRNEGRARVELREGSVESLPVKDEEFDGAICVQVLEYIEDATAALAELHRALRPGGRVVVWDVDWATVSWHSGDPARMERVLRAWDDHLAHPSLPRTLATRMRQVGFADIGVEGHTFATVEFTPEAYGVANISVIEKYLAPRGEEAQKWAAEQRELGARDEFFFACIQFCFSATRPE